MTKTVRAEVSQMGRDKRVKNADNFAKNTYEIIKKIKQQEEITSYRDTVKLLNENEVPTYCGGQWHVKTLQNLYKRCEKLGITQ